MQLYSGDLLPKDAWKMLENSDVFLVDVRTNAEWHYVGIPTDLPGNAMDSGQHKKLFMLEWLQWPNMENNANFVAELSTLVPDKNSTLIFLCRTGGRSRQAAITMSAEGYKHCYNLEGGFEGECDEHGHRGRINGWKAEGLPWGQS